MKILILDSGPLINLSMNGLLEILGKIKSIGIEIIITEYVHKEVVDRPLNIPRFELGALRIEELIKSKIIKIAEENGFVDKQELEMKTQKIITAANRSIRSENQPIQLISLAETSCLALSEILSKKGIENIIGIDERTTRLLFEKPENLREFMSGKLHRKLILNTNEIKQFGNFRFIRSSELVYVAYKKQFIKINDKRALEALLYATKYKGCAISWEEIDELKKL